MIGYYTKFKTRPEDRPKLVELLLQAANAMNVVEGCKLYDVLLDVRESSVIAVNEIWNDEQIHDASLRLDEAKTLIAKAVPLLVDPPKQTKFGSIIASWIS